LIGEPNAQPFGEAGETNQEAPETNPQTRDHHFGQRLMKVEDYGDGPEFQRQRAEDLEVGQGMNMNGLEGAMAMEADQLN